MNKDKIAKLIYELRKEKGLTQKELAEKLYISEQAISKWERGICLPNLTMIKELAKIFDISIAEFIAGEKITAENKLEQIDEIYFSSWQEEKRKSYFKSIMLYIIIIFLVIVFISLGFFFLKNYQRIYVYKFKGDTLHYLFTDGLAIYSDKEGLIKIGHFVKDNNFPIADETITKADITIYFDDKE